MNKNLKELLISVYRYASKILLGIVFFLIMGLRYNSLQVISRTLAITISAYILSYSLFTNIYGSFQIGKLKSKPVIYSTSLTVLFTNLITYFSLMVMLTNPNNVSANPTFRFESIQYLIIIFVVQVLLIYFLSYFGNYLYFLVNKPKRTLIIYQGTFEPSNALKSYLNQFKKQYSHIKEVSCDDSELHLEITLAEVVMITEMDPETRKSIVDFCYANNKSFSFSPSITDVIELSGTHITYGDMPMVDVDVTTFTIEQRFFKRTIDILFSFIGIIFTLPIWVIFVIAIKLDDGGPVFFKQERKTIHEKSFLVYKFRSMKVGAENISATQNDDRITRVGKVLRKIRLDELPQLINILKGDMSVVGPRPEMIENIEMYEKEMPEFKYRLRMKAGLTGLAQIEGKYNTTPEDKLILDLFYIENYSIWFDIKLIFKTAFIFFKKDSSEGFEN